MVTEIVRTEVNANTSRGRLKTALTALRKRANVAKEYVDYYEGRQPITYASDSYKDYFAKMVSRYRENICPAVIDSITDRLQVTGITIEAQEGPALADAPEAGGEDADAAQAEQAGPTPEEQAAAAVWAVWRANKMERRSGRVHKEATKAADSFVIVWPDPVTQAAHIYSQDSLKVYVHYDEETETIDWAVKYWLQDDDYGRAALYTPEAIERFITVDKVKTKTLGLPSERARWVPYAGDEGPYTANPYGRVPVFHFANDADTGEYGASELRDVLPIQDALNKATADMLVSMEFNAYPQRWATGMQIENDTVTGKPKTSFKPGSEHLWQNPDPEGRFGQFEAANLVQLIDVQNRFKAAAADVCGIPAHYMQMTPGNWPSGESLKTAEARFVAKVEDRQHAFGDVWADVLTFVAEIEGIALPGQISVLWQEASPRSDADMAAVALAKKQVGVSNEQLQRELGYSEEEIKRMGEEAQAQRELEADAMQQRLNSAGGNFGDRE